MANFITILRVLMAIAAVVLLFFTTKACYVTALVLTVFVMWFDGLDGYVARKLNETSKLGAVLDIMGDRIVENLYWLAFAVLGFISPAVPAIVLVRGIITDSLRSLALEQGYTAFGESTMMKGKVAKFIVASNFSRFTYAVAKAVAFVLVIASFLPVEYSFRDTVLTLKSAWCLFSPALDRLKLSTYLKCF
ncbi:CDP-alcohol phosphatidyltransferase [Candidatus Gastranaerophilus sp. (ex Termes propinquus)]|nr:CDP-alcohol phosphatidyltransferase [Candidatus Gastranaerophilus sp. (ex Termes propinquus)]